MTEHLPIVDRDGRTWTWGHDQFEDEGYITTIRGRYMYARTASEVEAEFGVRERVSA